MVVQEFDSPAVRMKNNTQEEFDRDKNPKEWLRARIYDGATCPCCGQFAKVYRRSITSTQARILIAMLRRNGTDWQYTAGRDNLDPSGQISYLKFWGLVEEQDSVRTDGGRPGWWRVTEAGADFANGFITVPKYAYVYNRKVRRIDGPQVGIRQTLGNRFNYDELMGRR